MSKSHLKGLVYFKCRKSGHVFSECGQQKSHFNLYVPKVKPMTIGKVYTMTRVEIAQNHDLIQGMCFIKGKTLNVLYDSSATHSFIFNDCVKHFEFPTSFLDVSLVVSTPTSEFVTTNKVCLNYSLFIKNRKFHVNLIYLPFSQLDVILGMDYSVSNQVFFLRFFVMIFLVCHPIEKLNF